jgi:hypothetical protein
MIVKPSHRALRAKAANANSIIKAVPFNSKAKFMASAGDLPLDMLCSSS